MSADASRQAQFFFLFFNEPLCVNPQLIIKVLTSKGPDKGCNFQGEKEISAYMDYVRERDLVMETLSYLKLFVLCMYTYTYRDTSTKFL